MNKAFDHNGTIVSTSRPVKQLKTVKKTVLIDSSDRDTTKYLTNGDVVYYLPRVYENVVSIRLKSATFPRIFAETSPGAVTHLYKNSSNGAISYDATGDLPVSTSDVETPHYFLVEVDGLNKFDETTVNAERSTFPDNFFARIPSTLSLHTKSSYFINYNDNTEEENKTIYYPAIGKLDRLHIVTRLHSQQNKKGFIYWTSTGAVANNNVEKAPGSDYSLVFELETLENGFDDFSSFESRISNREAGNYGC
jgi:hypothetical protein